MTIDTVELVTGVSIMVVTPALVQIAKQLGLPVRFAGLAAVICAILLMYLGGIARGEIISLSTLASWSLAGIVYGLAAAGLYSQTKVG